MSDFPFPTSQGLCTCGCVDWVHSLVIFSIWTEVWALCLFSLFLEFMFSNVLILWSLVKLKSGPLEIWTYHISLSLFRPAGGWADLSIIISVQEHWFPNYLLFIVHAVTHVTMVLWRCVLSHAMTEMRPAVARERNISNPLQCVQQSIYYNAYTWYASMNTFPIGCIVWFWVTEYVWEVCLYCHTMQYNTRSQGLRVNYISAQPIYSLLSNRLLHTAAVRSKCGVQ